MGTGPTVGPVPLVAEDEKVKELSKELFKNNIKWLDSLHIAIAEANNAEIFLTTDDKLVLNANKVKLNIRIINPLKWITEVLSYE